MISDDLESEVSFYEQVTGVPAIWPAPVFAEVHLPSCTIAFGHTQTAQLFNNSAVQRTTTPSSSSSSLMMWTKNFERLKSLVSEWVQEPTTMPWGNRSTLFRDPDGNLVNLFTPVTEDAIKRFLEPTAGAQAAAGEAAVDAGMATESGELSGP
jgi:predicted enzyme related to lactoylglutathione lyase